MLLRVCPSKALLHTVHECFQCFTVSHHFCSLPLLPMPPNEIPRHASTPRRLIFDSNAFLHFCGQQHPHLLQYILRRMKIPQQTRHKRAQQMPVTDEISGSFLDGMGFGGHGSISRPMKRRNGDKLFLAFLTPRSILPMVSRLMTHSRARVDVAQTHRFPECLQAPHILPSCLERREAFGVGESWSHGRGSRRVDSISPSWFFSCQRRGVALGWTS